MNALRNMIVYSFLVLPLFHYQFIRHLKENIVIEIHKRKEEIVKCKNKDSFYLQVHINY